jgi:signal transduction histidine kinase
MRHAAFSGVRTPHRSGSRGILASAARLDRWLHLVLVALVVSSAVRYAGRHELDTSGMLVLTGGAVLIAVYVARPLVPAHDWWSTLWVTMATIVWVALTVVAPSFAWTAVPLAFAALEVLAFPWAVGVVALMTTVVSLGWLRLVDSFDPTVVAGPIGIALVTVLAYRTLEQQARTRQRLLDDLVAAQEDLAVAQRRSGALAERARLSAEIHDSVGQGLSSINLLLNAAEQVWQRSPDAARDHVRAAAEAARGGLDEARRMVRGLAPAELDGPDPVLALPEALARVAAQAGMPGVEVRVHGAAQPVPDAVAGALVRTARGALANVVEHAAAAHAVVTLTFHPDEVLLDVRDDGTGFDTRRARSAGMRGHGLRGIVQRAESLGGRAAIESAPGEGASVSVAFPLVRGAIG